MGLFGPRSKEPPPLVLHSRGRPSGWGRVGHEPSWQELIRDPRKAHLAHDRAIRDLESAGQKIPFISPVVLGTPDA